jgi:hypothetical protein
VRFLRRNSADNSEAIAEEAVTVDEESAHRAYTPGKGKPTPKRREAEARKRGPVAPAPKTTREAMKRNRGSKEDRRAQTRERRERMMAGEDKYLMPRDRGPVKAYVRDVVDSRPHLMGLFMPLAVIVLISVLLPIPAAQQYLSLFSLVALAVMVAEGVTLGIQITKKARAKFPEENISGLGTGWYAFTRASQLRKLRVPKPRVQRGAQV